MSSLPIRLRCLELAEDVLRAEFVRRGTDRHTSARALSLATAIQEAIEAWAADHDDDDGPDEEVVSS